ncbi:MAG: hypothetical protein LBD62_05545 [Candidatus Margulisbacteria bacterium]|jgi:hypothetical protein|nr:hypothetical protein [Candidatus Margulisiibacteriota bacterium]
MTTETAAVKKILDEIYMIRDELYEKTKNLTEIEHAAFFNKAAEEFCRKKNIVFPNSRN